MADPIAKRDENPPAPKPKWGAEPWPPIGNGPQPTRRNPGITECCGGSVYNAHGFGVCHGPRWIGRLRGYRPVLPLRPLTPPPVAPRGDGGISKVSS